MMKFVRSELDVVLWTGVLQLVLVTTFLAGWTLRDAFMPEVDPKAATESQAKQPESAISTPPVPLPVPMRLDTKGGLDLEPAATAEAVPRKAGDTNVPEAVAAVTSPEDEPADVTGQEGGNGPAMSAVLRIDRRSGALSIGSFETVTLDGGADQCLAMGRMLLQDAGARDDQLEVLAQSKAITMARICASNGSVVITCRRNQITISPRRLKPNESCAG